MEAGPEGVEVAAFKSVSCLNKKLNVSMDHSSKHCSIVMGVTH